MGKLKDIFLYTEGKLEDLKLKFPHEPVQLFYDSDPSPTKKYVQWMLKQFNQTNSSANLIIQTIQRFDSLINKLKNKDINSYKSISDLQSILDNISSSRKEREKIKKEGSRKIYEDDECIILRINTKEACMLYGSNTQWCITMKDDPYYEDYVVDQNVFYFIIRKIKKEDGLDKVALSIFKNKFGNQVIEFWDQKGKEFFNLKSYFKNYKNIISVCVNDFVNNESNDIYFRFANREFTEEEYNNAISKINDEKLIKKIKNIILNNEKAPKAVKDKIIMGESRSLKSRKLNEIMGGNMIRPYDPRPAGQGRIPISPQFSSGAPSMDPSVQMSQKQQTIMTPEDIEYWEDASFDPPYDLNQNRTGDLDIDLNGIQKESKNKMNIIMLKDFIKEAISKIVDEDDAEEDKPEMDEFSAVGGAGGAMGGSSIRGHMGSKLPMKNKKKLGQR